MNRINMVVLVSLSFILTGCFSSGDINFIYDADDIIGRGYSCGWFEGDSQIACEIGLYNTNEFDSLEIGVPMLFVLDKDGCMLCNAEGQVITIEPEESTNMNLSCALPERGRQDVDIIFSFDEDYVESTC